MFFSNEETATAAAQEVIITDQLDAVHEDLSTVSLGPIGFNDQLLSPPAGATDFASLVDLRPAKNLLVQVQAHLEVSTGLLTWRFTSLDPTTYQRPADPSAGFLPPGGSGSVVFTVMPKPGLATNTQIQNQATIVFDANAPIPTPVWVNTLDKTPPTSQVTTLPATVGGRNFTVQWSGTDIGSGIQDYTVFVSQDGGAFTQFVTDTTATSATFTGQPGHSYAFFSLARDQVGNVEQKLQVGETSTRVLGDTIPPTTTATVTPAPNSNGWNNTAVTVGLSAVDNPGGSGVKQITYSLTGAQVGDATVTGGSTSVIVSAEGLTSLTYFATDNAGNRETVKTLTLQIDKTPPTVTFATPAPAPNAAGWNNTNVSVSFTANDNLSGVATTSITSPLILTTEGTAVTGTVTATDKAGNSATFSSPPAKIDKTPPTTACVPVPRPRREDDDSHGRLLFQVTASDTLSQVATITLGNVELANGEIIRIQATERPGAQVVLKTDDDDRDAPRIRRFRVGPGAAVINATDNAGNVGTAVCPLPLRHEDEQGDRGKGR